jgi:hypothetical protein
MVQKMSTRVKLQIGDTGLQTLKQFVAEGIEFC